jgi:hypothetical protein
MVDGRVDTPIGPVPRVHSRIGRRDLLGRWRVRWGIGRDRYRVAPGMYALGAPDGNAPVLVTANYKMTFDVVRRDWTPGSWSSTPAGSTSGAPPGRGCSEPKR